jgi:hypothetical protein
MKTLIKITTDLFNVLADDIYKEDLNYLINELNIHCNIENDNYNNVVEIEKRYCSAEKYDNSVKITAKGYTGGEWQTFEILYNESEIQTKEEKLNFKDLQEKLKKFFTHKNCYFAEKFEYVEIDGKMFINNEAFDFTSFCIDWEEFPTTEDIEEAYLNLYGKDFDKIEINID